MNIKNAITATAMLVASNISFADQLFHPVTGDLVLDTDTAEYSSSCTNNELSLNDDGSMDLVYNNFNVIGGTPEFDKTCQFKIKLNVPSGWIVRVTTEAAIGGNYVAPALVSFQHEVAGKVRQAAFNYFPAGFNSYVLNQELDHIGHSVCNEETMTLKTVSNIVALSNGAFVNVNNGAIDGETTAWRYHFQFDPC
ncbi:MAG: DUF4360 domain-containing protein [Exilibacterium sp.]